MGITGESGQEAQYHLLQPQHQPLKRCIINISTSLYYLTKERDKDKMDKETFEEKIQELGKLESAEEMRAGLAELTNSLAEMFDANASLSEQHEADLKEMEAIRQANMKLFTQRGSQKTPQEQTIEQTGLKQDEPQPRRSFDTLLKNIKL